MRILLNNNYIKDSSIILNFNLLKKIAIILDKCFDYDKQHKCRHCENEALIKCFLDVSKRSYICLFKC